MASQTDTEPERPSDPSLWEIVRGLGRQEGQTEQIVARLDRIEARLDRLIFFMFGLGAGIITILVKLFVDG